LFKPMTTVFFAEADLDFRCLLSNTLFLLQSRQPVGLGSPHLSIPHSPRLWIGSMMASCRTPSNRSDKRVYSSGQHKRSKRRCLPRSKIQASVSSKRIRAILVLLADSCGTQRAKEWCQQRQSTWNKDHHGRNHDAKARHHLFVNNPTPAHSQSRSWLVLRHLLVFIDTSGKRSLCGRS
jgi:hypothetical protein